VTNGLTEQEFAYLCSMFDLARAGDTGALSQALDAGIPANLTNGAGDSLLILAAYHDHPDTVEALLARGADTGRVNDRGQTALGAAVFRRSERTVTLLLEAGADPARGPKSALDVARFFDLPEMLALLTGQETRAGVRETG
jgi:ankyrin repeat protein